MENPTCDTEKVVAALEQQGYKVLLLDLRQTCRRANESDPKSGCKAWNQNEADLCTVAVATNLKVAIEEYGIKIVSVVSMAEVWYRQYPMLVDLSDLLKDSLRGKPYYHSNVHLGWIGTSGSRLSERAKAIEYAKNFRHLANNLSSNGIIQASGDAIYSVMFEKLAERYKLCENEDEVDGKCSSEMMQASREMIAVFKAQLDGVKLEEKDEDGRLDGAVRHSRKRVLPENDLASVEAGEGTTRKKAKKTDKNKIGNTDLRLTGKNNKKEKNGNFEVVVAAPPVPRTPMTTMQELALAMLLPSYPEPVAHPPARFYTVPVDPAPKPAAPFPTMAQCNPPPGTELRSLAPKPS